VLLEQYIQDPTLTQSVDLTDNIEFENVEAVEADIEKKVKLLHLHDCHYKIV